MNREDVVSSLEASYPSIRCLWIRYSYSLLGGGDYMINTNTEVLLLRCFLRYGVINDIKLVSSSFDQVRVFMLYSHNSDVGFCLINFFCLSLVYAKARRLGTNSLWISSNRESYTWFVSPIFVSYFFVRHCFIQTWRTHICLSWRIGTLCTKWWTYSWSFVLFYVRMILSPLSPHITFCLFMSFNFHCFSYTCFLSNRKLLLFSITTQLDEGLDMCVVG